MINPVALAESLGGEVNVFISFGSLGSALFAPPPAGADVSESKHRLALTRTAAGLAGTRGVCSFIMLNPSTADHHKNDNTIRRTIGYATAWGFRELIIGNAFALRSRDPKALYKLEARDAIGVDNDRAISAIARASELVVCGWGNHGTLHDRGVRVLRLIREAGRVPHALRITGTGQPEHPLYLPKALTPEPIPA